MSAVGDARKRGLQVMNPEEERDALAELLNDSLEREAVLETRLTEARANRDRLAHELADARAALAALDGTCR